MVIQLHLFLLITICSFPWYYYYYYYYYCQVLSDLIYVFVINKRAETAITPRALEEVP